MDNECLNAPLVIKPTRIYSYTQLIACLKKKQQKLAKYKVTAEPTAFRNVLKPKQQQFDVNDVVNGVLHEKLKLKQKEHEKMATKAFIKDVERRINQIKKENDLFVVGQGKIAGKVGDLELVFDKDPADADEQLSHGITGKDRYFEDPMLFDIHMFLRRLKTSENFEQEIQFLGDEYLRYVDRFLRENADKVSSPLKDVEEKICTFVKLRYGKEEYKLEVYEGRYVFAELYTLFRCGLTDSVKRLLERFSVFFEHISHRFKTSFSGWLVTKMKPSVTVKIGSGDDLFKAFLLGMMDGSNRGVDASVIGSVEDFVWMHLISINELGGVKEVLGLFKNYQNPKGLLLACVMLKDYDKAMELVFRGDFAVVPSYFLMKTLCSRCNNKMVFVDFVFLAASRFSSTRRKVELLSSLKHVVDGYYEVVPEMIVKMDMYDVLGMDDGACLYLDKKINQRVVEILKAKNEKKKLIKLYYLIDDEAMVVDLINEIIVEAILADGDIDTYFEIIEYYEKRESTRQIGMMRGLKSFYIFKRNPSMLTLRSTPLISMDVDIKELRYVVEKVFKLACDVVENTGDGEMARMLFRLCGILGLGEEMSGYANRHLILLI
ncbi:hypothetical protein M896_040500 [Ordospora colligata OC4]|uniref:Nuclear pore protein n=1 Tax=Ordospora colligata OC4 TaxID=1354746 RepID=A0A0B2ULF0_9MICR|nr:uncharacterized protein M896_040500 [Ordospora colligata OC4]KHN69857.1 hypothetical protein M896_040500 [Ordospora colligata OC4]TBU16027.1 hypothetical protein CWI41_040500 [Ordospora colligata]TBU16240.1 hypothetical protein CWI40_040500 [Ordospora colligata]